MKVLFGLFAACASACIAATAGAATGTETFDLIFRSGTLGDLPEATVVDYTQTGTSAGENGGAVKDAIRLTIGAEDQTTLQRVRDGKTGSMGSFKTSVGNPIIMFFMESVVREVAEVSGGSPFYIRNRFKEALLDEVTVEPVTVPFGGDEVSAERVVLHPMQGDRHAAEAGVDDVELEFVMSEDVPGWYYALAATGGEAEKAFENRIMLEGLAEPGH
jgi:hypothetical protein